MTRLSARLAGAAAVILGLAGFALLLAVGLALGGVSAAAASTAGLSSCSTTAGVLVAVDFSHFGGSVDLGCAAGTQVDGVRATERAGFLVAGDEESGDAFVCRIGVATEGVRSERPTPSEDPCVSTPPASAYWAFWVADAGQSRWSYSETGAAAYKPPPGSIEGWAFGSGGPPTVSPAQVRAEASQSSPSTTTSTTSSTTSTTLAGASVTPPSTTVVSHRHVTHRDHAGGERTRSGSSGSRSPGSAGPPHIVVVNAADGAPATAVGGSATGLILTFVLVGVMSVAGGLLAWRRKRA